MPDQNQPNDPTQNPTPGNTPIDPTTSQRPVFTTEEVPATNPSIQDPTQAGSMAPNPTLPPEPSPFSVPETTDVPPPPVNQTEEATTPPTSSDGTSAPSSDLPPVVGATPRKKFGGKKVISTILGLLLLIGGVGAGVTLVRQQQDIREQAKGATCDEKSAAQCAGKPAGTICSGGDGVCTLKGGGSCSCNTQSKVCNAKGAAGCAGRNPGDPCSGGTCGNIQSNGGCACVAKAGAETGSTTTTSSGGTQGASCNLSTGKRCASGFKCVEPPGAGGDGTCESTSNSGGGSTCSPASDGFCNTKNLGASCGTGKTCQVPSTDPGAEDAVGRPICQCKSAGTSGEGTTGNTGGSSGGGGSSAVKPSNECSNASAAQCDQGVKIGDTCHQGRGTCIDTGKDGGDGQPVCRCKVPEDKCTEACPTTDGTRLLNCTPPEADGTPEESICSKAGRVESCGGKSYCCPAAGGKWSTNISACEGSGQCLNVKAYDTTFNALTTDQLKALKAGDKIRFAVGGSQSGTSGTFDKAKFKINSTESGEIATQKPGSNEFWYEYTIPDGTTSFSITAQIHHTVLGWSN